MRQKLTFIRAVPLLSYLRFPTLVRMTHTNKLVNERSSYLLQHCHNPVNWYPWGQEAFQKAKEHNFPIFLSVGYSTCHWCHVMEHESFENEDIAKLLNDNFVSIKVDREERPDVDKLYMSFVQVITGSGGWPMNVFLTPDLEPLTGGTYFPKDAFAQVLKLIAQQWKEKNADVLRQGKGLADAMRQSLVQKQGDLPCLETVLRNVHSHLSRQFDKEHGGFGLAPKFPKPVDMDFLLHYYSMNKTTESGKNALEMVGKTLEKMANGGIHDHVGKGFHRYSVDETWLVPHFEKMLYDQAQLLQLYANYNKLTGGKHADIVKDIVEYMNTCLSHPEGGFYCGEDADSFPTADATKKREGAFCVWTRREVEEALYPFSTANENISLDEVFCRVYNLEENGNVPSYLDPHKELTGQNILKRMERDRLAEYATECRMTIDDLIDSLERGKSVLAKKRAKRPKPHLDTKLLTSWNALAVSGLCVAATSVAAMDASSAKELTDRARKTLNFIKKYLTDESGRLLHSAYTDEAGTGVVQIEHPIFAFSDDYAFLIQALIDAYEITFDESLLKWAVDLQAVMDAEFWDADNRSGYFLSRADEQSPLFARVQEDQDGAEPCTLSVAVSNLLRLSALFDEEQMQKRAADCLRSASARLEKHPYILTRMCSAIYMFTNAAAEIIVVGGKDDERTKKLVATVQSKFVPHKYLVFLNTDDGVSNDKYLVSKNKHFEELLNTERKTNSKPLVYVCRNYACQMPIEAPEDVEKEF